MDVTFLALAGASKHQARQHSSTESARYLSRKISSPESTISEPVSFQASLRQSTLDSSPRCALGIDPPIPCVRSVVDKYDLPPLIPHDVPSMQRLLYSAHAHCDLFHRLGEFRASRALARLLKDLRVAHELPLLNVDGMFGEFSLESVEAESKAPMSPTMDSTQDMALLGFDGESQKRTKRLGVHCVVCCERVRTLYMPCLSCGHGFHISCFREWFATPDQKCPSIGCECCCVLIEQSMAYCQHILASLVSAAFDS